MRNFDYLDKDMALKVANAYEAGLLSDQDAIDFFQLLLLSDNVMQYMPPIYSDIIDLLLMRGNISHLTDEYDSLDMRANPKTKHLKIKTQSNILNDEERARFPHLAQSLDDSVDRVLLRSPFNYAGNKLDLISQIFPNLNFQSTFVDMFGGSGVISLNLLQNEKFYPSSIKSSTINQESILFEFDKKIADIHKTMALLHPEVSFALVLSIINKFKLRDFTNMSEADYKAFKESKLSDRNWLRKINQDPITQLAAMFFSKQKSIDTLSQDIHRFIDGKSKTTKPLVKLKEKSIYCLMYFVMYIYHLTVQDIKLSMDKTRYIITAGGGGFTSNSKINFLLCAYRLYVANRKPVPIGSTLDHNFMDQYTKDTRPFADGLMDEMINNEKTLSPLQLKSVAIKLFERTTTQGNFFRNKDSVMHYNNIPKIYILNDSSIPYTDSNNITQNTMLDITKPVRQANSSTINKCFYYADPPYFASGVAYSGWGQAEELSLLKTLDDVHANGDFFALSNVTDHAGLSNYLLKRWLMSNKYIHVSLLSKKYQSQTGTGGDGDLWVTVEILATNYPHANSQPFSSLKSQIESLFIEKDLKYDHEGRYGLKYTLEQKS
jgi:site-specific DNA-adenine methylase